MEEIVKLIHATGFPIVITLLLYFDLRKLIHNNTAAIRELTQQQESLTGTLKGLIQNNR
ncbi:MAG: hypothetical protein AAB019_08290 [Planctomycetota bacterium]